MQERTVISNKVQGLHYHLHNRYVHAKVIAKMASTSGTAEQPRSFHGCQR